MNTAERILVLQVNYLGDFVAMLPLLFGLRKLAPKAAISMITSPAGRDLLEESELVDEVLAFKFDEYRSLWKKPGQLLGLVSKLRASAFDVSISAHDECSVSALLSVLASVPTRIGYKSRAKAGIFYNRKLVFDPVLDVVENRYRSLAEFAGEFRPGTTLPPLERVPVIFAAEERKEFEEFFDIDPDLKFIAIQPFAKAEYKAWAPQRYAEIAYEVSRSEPDYSCLIITDNKPFKFNYESGDTRIINQTSVRELAWLLGRASLFVGNNSGPMNLAVAMGTPVVAIHGPSPLWWWPHEFADSRVANVHAGLECAHCEKTGIMKGCPRGLVPSECMDRIPVEKVLKTVLGLLRECAL